MSRIFSEEHLKKLEDELEFTLLAIGQLTSRIKYYIQSEGHDATHLALLDLKKEKVKLEVKLDALNQYMEE
jgi:hypothetical protein